MTELTGIINKSMQNQQEPVAIWATSNRSARIVFYAAFRNNHHFLQESSRMHLNSACSQQELTGIPELIFKAGKPRVVTD